MAEIKFVDTWPARNPPAEPGENWYVEPFTKRTGCQTPGQCSDDCDCGCSYNTMTQVDQLPLIETIAEIFPNEWLAFIISPAEDEDYEPSHGKLIAHSPHPDEVYDAVNTVLWNQHVYVFFNGDFEHLQTSYGDTWTQPASKQPVTVNATKADPSLTPPPDDLIDLIYSAIDQLYETPHLNEAIRRLRLARARATTVDHRLLPVLDHALEKIETPAPTLNEAIWHLEEALAEVSPGS